MLVIRTCTKLLQRQEWGHYSPPCSSIQPSCQASKQLTALRVRQSPMVSSANMILPQPWTSHSEGLIDLTPYRTELFRSTMGRHIQDLTTKSRRIPDFVLELVEVKQEDGKPIIPYQIKCHRTLLIIEIKPARPYAAAVLAFRDVWQF